MPANPGAPTREQIAATQIGQRVLDLRQRKGWSLRDMAHLCDVSPATLSRIERGTAAHLSLELFGRVAQVLGVPSGELLASPTPQPAASAVTEEMVKAALRGWYSRTQASEVNGARDDMRAALTAALAASPQPQGADAGTRRHQAPPFDTLKGMQFFAKDSDGNWYYVNHGETWQTMPSPYSEAATLAQPEARDTDAAEAIATALWHRFAPSHHVGWEEESEKAIYRDAASQVVALVAQPEARSAWSCAARRGNTGADPQDCDWPVCGCDPAANKVIASLEEAGVLKPEARSVGEAELRKVVQGFLTWADQKCPCSNEQPNPCPLCGASVENLEPCKAADRTLPRRLLADARAALSPRTPTAEGDHG